MTNNKKTKERFTSAALNSERRYASFLETIFHGIQENDTSGIITFSNAAHHRMLGYADGELIGKTIWDILPTESERDELRAYLAMLVKDEPPPTPYIAKSTRKDGSRIDTQVDWNYVRDNHGILTGFISVITDITDRKHAEQALRESEERFRNAFENAPIGMAIVGLDERFLQVNQALCTILGYSREALLATTVPAVTHPDDRSMEVDHKQQARDGSVQNFQMGKRYLHADGHVVWGNLSVSLVQDSRERPLFYIGQLEDVTERKKLEAQLLQSQKMEAVGQLAGGIAHDFNNILTAIMGYGNILQMQMEHTNPLRAQVDHIIASSERAAQLTQGLLAFSRKQAIRLLPVEVNGIVSRVAKLLVHLIGEDIDIKKILSDDEIIVMADAGQIEHILMNLATNARDAMPDGGTLIIDTRSVELDDEYVKAHGYGEPGRYAVLSITDSGTGMDEGTRDRIFEPFFTTKESGRGTGLGLAMVYGIIKQHGGHITAYSEPGKGTTFTIYLPRITSEAIAAQPEKARTPPGGTETILVGEDDATLRSLARTVLENVGYTVIMAEDGEDTVRQFRDHSEAIQLLLLDVIMPGKNGKEAYEEIRKVKPDVKVLFTSGYTADLIQKKGILDGDINLVYKPVSPTELLIKIREVLDN